MNKHYFRKMQYSLLLLLISFSSGLAYGQGRITPPIGDSVILNRLVLLFLMWIFLITTM